MDGEPLISCIIPAYNAADTIVRAIESARGQTYPNVEIVVVNDGSTDATENVVLCRYPDVIYVKHQDNLGPPSARNSGVQAASGEYVAFLDADDEWVPECVACLVEALSLFQDAIIVPQLLNVDVDGRTRPETLSAGDATLRPVDFCAAFKTPSPCLLRTSTYRKIGGQDPRLKVFEDLDFYARAVSDGIAVYRLPEPLYLCHSSPYSLTRSQATAAARCAYACRLYAKWDPTRNAAARRLTSYDHYRAVAFEGLCWCAWKAAQAGAMEVARDTFRVAAQYCPRRVRPLLKLFLQSRPVVVHVWKLYAAIRSRGSTMCRSGKAPAKGCFSLLILAY